MIRLTRAFALAALVAAAPAALVVPAPAEAKPALGPGERVDLNHAPLDDLMKLPGVGRKRAEAIVALRERRPFRRPEDLALVKGISPAWVSKHRALLDASAPPAVAKAK